MSTAFIFITGQFRSFNFSMFNKKKWTWLLKVAFYQNRYKQKNKRKQEKNTYWILKRSFYPKYTTLFGMSFT